MLQRIYDFIFLEHPIQALWTSKSLPCVTDSVRNSWISIMWCDWRVHRTWQSMRQGTDASGRGWNMCALESRSSF